VDRQLGAGEFPPACGEATRDVQTETLDVDAMPRSRSSISMYTWTSGRAAIVRRAVAPARSSPPRRVRRRPIQTPSRRPRTLDELTRQPRREEAQFPAGTRREHCRSDCGVLKLGHCSGEDIPSSRRAQGVTGRVRYRRGAGSWSGVASGGVRGLRSGGSWSGLAARFRTVAAVRSRGAWRTSASTGR
jgi:hypothetical protein